ncbi:ATP-binding cassette domain-containing protein [Nocardia uniformis]|uniref:ATP-binding cassette domain-containing protein n=1 Tax=Nocardia uniformis TaxID=53432 RepID=A0A849BTI5_9NOCA|nr:ATP-binding cassette domain-containing protein [Nocardia uniformis]NNH69932.1 ATP-binding cassette domain-containing protein [Nocardia uniformis]
MNSSGRTAAAPLIQCRGLTKTYGADNAVDNLSFSVPAGTITGFIGANGAGKTTTMRMLLGLAAPTSGTALIHGQPYRDLVDPRCRVGAVLDGPGAHPRHTARTHLRILATAAGVPRSRVEEVLDMVELSRDAGKRVGRFSLGMRQRLALAGALLGDPQVLMLDEPVNGLDPRGILWMRELLRELAGAGRAILVSSHLLTELGEVADRLVIIDHGRLVADATTAELSAGGRSLEDVYFELAGSLGDTGRGASGKKVAS